MHSEAIRYTASVSLEGILVVILALAPAAAADQSTSGEKTPEPAAAAGKTTVPRNEQTTPPSTVTVTTVPAPEKPAPEKPAPEKSVTAEPVPEKSAPKNSVPEPSQESREQIEPIAEPQQTGPVEIDAASFKGVTPGITTVAELEKSWGAPKEISRQDGMAVRLYSVEPFDHVEVSLLEDKVTSVVIRLKKAFPASVVAKQLQLSNIRPVMVSDETGQILGQAFAERGVLFAFEPAKEPGKMTGMVSQIVLEPIDAEPFVLRAETNLDSQYELSLRDLDVALKLRPRYPRAHWLRARVLSAMGNPVQALAASTKAVQLEAGNARYHVTHAQILGQAGRYDEAVEHAQKALQLSERRLHVKARALCLLGDLASTRPKRDYKKAIEYHMEAIKVADPLAVDRHPAIRLAAKEVLIDAHLGTAGDIAWGNWKKKEEAVPRWLERASEFAEDLIENDGGTDEHRFRVATRALSACVGAQGSVDPTDWAEKTVRVGRQLVDSVKDKTQKEQFRWELGMALYDALQIYQIRGNHDLALRYGQQAIDCLSEGGENKQDAPAYGYLLGRLCFRLGAIHAQAKRDHKAAVTWFDKATPLLSKPLPQGAQSELGRRGETFVSMGVSYWETGDKKNAMQLTRQGVVLIEQAVRNGTASRTRLEVPYSNLATMHQQLGQAATAEEFIQKADRIKDTKLR